MKICAPVQNLDISAVITAHHEGTLAHRTLQSVWRSVRHAAGHGLTCEVLVVMDRPDQPTRDYFTKYQPEVRLLEVDFGDTGLTRNHGAQNALGQYVSFLDGDDLFSEQWFYRVHQEARARAGLSAVFHPGYTVHFGMDSAIRHHRSTLDREFSVLSLLENWHWNSAAMLDRKLALQHPFRECRPGSGFGSEDWHWYCELVAAGIEVIAVDGTCLFYRRRNGSRCSAHEGTVVRPSRLFDLDVLRHRVVEDAQRKMQAGAQPAIARRQVNLAEPGLLARALKTPPRYWPWKVGRRCLSPAVRARIKAVGRHLPKGVRAAVRAKLMLLAPSAFKSGEMVARELPQWLLEEWRALNALEPQLFPDQQTVSKLWDSKIPEPHMGFDYLKLCEQIETPVSHVFLVPWLKTGGSDRTAINYVKALHDRKLANGIVVIATEPTDSPWACHLPPSVGFVDFGRQFAHLNEWQREQLLVRFLLQRQPQVIHNINSWLGYNVYVKVASALADRSRLYAHVFCDDISPEGRTTGYNRLYLPQCIQHLTAAISDNQTELDALAGIFAFDRAKLLTHYQPVDLAPIQRRPIGDRLDVLWAARLDRQKRPDLLEQTARICRDMPITFHAYGASVLEGDRVAPPAGPNIRFHGPFDGFSSLPLERFDVFLYTSQWDGMPNVLLEAAANGLPIVASDVGGVHELIHDGETGLLASPYDDPERYRSALLSLLTKQIDSQSMSYQALRLLATRHSWEAFVNSLCDIPGYIVAGLAGGVLQPLPDARHDRAA
jgi:glycosyltransferase involved in cell wall biosynthesis